MRQCWDTDMANGLDTRVMEMPSWLRPKQEWTAAHTLQALNMGAEVKQQQQRNVLAVRELMLREQYQTALNEKRLAVLEAQQAEIDDLPLLDQYAQNPDAGIPAFKSPKSYQKLQSIDLARSRSNLGKQTAADMTNFNQRLAKVDARDRFAIVDMQRQGADAADVWDALSIAEAKQRDALAATRQFAPDAFQKAVEYAQRLEAIPSTKPELIAQAWERVATIARGGKLTGQAKVPEQGKGEPQKNFIERLKNFFGFGASTEGTVNAPLGPVVLSPGGADTRTQVPQQAPTASPTALPKATTAEQVNAEADAALKRGAPPAAVEARRRQLLEQLVVPEMQDAISQMVRDALEAKPINPVGEPRGATPPF